MLTVAEEYARRDGFAPGLTLKVFGQEYNGESHAICGSDLMIKGEDPGNIVFGDTLGDGKTRDGFQDHKFHYMLANPPFGVEWKRQSDVVEKEHTGIGFKGSPLFTGDAGSGESEIRRWVIENDWLEAIIGLPDQMFYNTGILTYVWIVTNRKAEHRRGKVQFIDATTMSQKMRKSLGNKRNEMSDAQIAEVTRLYADFNPGERVRVFDNREFGYVRLTVERPLRLNFQVGAERIALLRDESAFKALAESKKRKDKAEAAAEEAAGREQQRLIVAALESMDGTQLYRSRPVFVGALDAALRDASLKVAAPVRKAILGTLSERDETADICREKDDPTGLPEPDPELRDTENVPLPGDFPLPAPIAYGKDADNEQLVAAVKDHCAAYFDREVRPHVPDAWIDHGKTRLGFEIPFNRHFYQYTPPRPLEAIEADLRSLEGEILALLGEVGR